MKSAATAVCGDNRFSCVRSPDNIRQRYKLGRVIGNHLILTELEALYLLVKKLIYPPDGTSVEEIMLKLIRTDSDIDYLQVYASLKSLGLYVRKEADGLSYRKDSRTEYSDSVRIALEDSSISFQKLFEHKQSLWATLDNQGDVTFFHSERYEPAGESERPSDDIEVKTIEKRGFTNNIDGEWIGEDFFGLKLLSSSESEYFSGDHKGLESRVFSDLVKRRCLVKTGFKYGCNFRVYLRSIEEHAEILVSVMKGEEEWFKVSRAVRLAHAVRKEILFAADEGGRIQYVRLERIPQEYLKN